MAMVNGKPILEHLVNHLNKYGITEIIVNVHENYDKIFKYFGTRLLYLYEPVLLGESGTERVLQNWLGDEYIVMNGDTLTNINIEKLRQRLIDTQADGVFFTKERYGGTKIMAPTRPGGHDYWDGDGAYYFDCGTPKKLAKARKYYESLS